MSAADLIPAVPDGRGDYAKGYRAGVAAMRILAAGLTVEQMREHAHRHVLPKGGPVRTDYEHGVSDAFDKWLSNARASVPA